MRSYRPRPATATDLPMILRAERDYIVAVEPEQIPSWTAAIDRNRALWIDNLQRTTFLVLDDEGGADDDDTVAGFVMWTPNTNTNTNTDTDTDERVSAAATLITIQVLPAYRRQGLGRQLLDLFAKQARAAGAQTLRLGVHERNPARGLYPSAGYVRTGRDGHYLLYELTTPPGRS